MSVCIFCLAILLTCGSAWADSIGILLRQLFLAQGDHGIDRARAARRDVAGDERS